MRTEEHSSISETAGGQRPVGERPVWAWTIAETAVALRAGRLTAVDVVEAHLARIRDVDHILNAFIRVDADAAIEAALKAADEIKSGGWRGPLHGIPFAVKDNYDVAGIPATAGSALRLHHVPDRDADLVSKLRDAGAILIGKLATWEYGTGNGGEYFDLPFPPARNPWDTARYTGGSSTGAGVAVATGLVKFALGSDTTGSVRLPAAATGTVGLIATPGRLSTAGILPNCYSLDVPGSIAWTVEDLAIVSAALTDDSRLAVSSPTDLRGWRIGIVRDTGPRWSAPDEEIAAAFETGLLEFERLGAQLLELQLPVPAADCFAVTRVIGPSESAAIHEAELRERPGDMGFALRDKLLSGSLVRAVDYITAQRRRLEIAQAIDTMMNGVDILVTFGALHVPPLLGVEPEMTAYTVDTMLTPFNLSGHPALVQCNGFSRGGLPMHWQLVAGRGSEAKLLSAAAAFEAATSWRNQRPIPAAPPPAPVPARADMTSGNIEEARSFARRHGLDRLQEDHLGRLAALIGPVAATGLALSRPAHKDTPPAPSFEVWHPDCQPPTK
jgi:aspartyl-tRNA(Asn)/glutamyl-tRNA(Gln) amidotransferase subunit A